MVTSWTFLVSYTFSLKLSNLNVCVGFHHGSQWVESFDGVIQGHEMKSWELRWSLSVCIFQGLTHSDVVLLTLLQRQQGFIWVYDIN